MHKSVFTPDNASVLLIDHQYGTMAFRHSRDFNLIRENTFKLARIAKAPSMPTVLTTSLEDGPLGPLFTELEGILPCRS